MSDDNSDEYIRVSHMSIKCDELTRGAVVECVRLFNIIGCGSGKWSKCAARRRRCCGRGGCCAMFQTRGTVDMFELSHYECLFLLGTKNLRLMRMTSFADRVFSHRVDLRRDNDEDLQVREKEHACVSLSVGRNMSASRRRGISLSPGRQSIKQFRRDTCNIHLERMNLFFKYSNRLG